MSLVQTLKEGTLGGAILRKLKGGETPTSIAKWLQGDLLEFTSIPEVKLASEIKKLFNESFPLEQRLSIVQNRGAIRETVAQHREAMDTEEELTKLYYLQVGRIEQEHSIEKKINKLMGGLGNEVELARRLLGDINKHRQDSGLAPQAVQRVDVTTGGQPLTDITMKIGLLAKRLVDGQTKDVPADEVKTLDAEPSSNPAAPLPAPSMSPTVEDISDQLGGESL